MFQFAKTNSRWLMALFFMSMCSAFGQTFFIAVFGAALRAEFGLSHGDWGGIFALGTFASAAAMLIAGGIVDHLSMRRVFIGVTVGLAAAMAFIANATQAWMLIPAIFMLRFFGQGMTTHVSQVTAVRWFTQNRAKVLAFTVLGVGASEAFFPRIFVAVMIKVGWRDAWLVGIAVLAVIATLAMILAARDRTAAGDLKPQKSTGMDGLYWTRSMMLRNWVYWLALPALIAQPLITTTFFFQFTHLTEIKHWDLAAFTAYIPIYTFSSFTGLMLLGWLADRFSARAVLPFFLLPLVIGFAVMSGLRDFDLLIVPLLFIGFSHGAASAVLGVFWVEFYGTRHLGSVRAVGTSTMVFATAMGPFLSGRGIDAGLDYETQMIIMAIYGFIACLIFGIVSLGTRKGLAK